MSNHALLALVLLATSGCSRELAAPRPPEAPKPPGPPEDDGPITAAERTAVIDALAAALEQHYVFADKAVLVDKALHDHLARGDYTKLASANAFAETVTADMRALVHDKHLEIRYFAEPIGPEQGGEQAAEMQYNNQGIFDVRRMRFNIGYLNFFAFGDPGPFAEKLAAAMQLVHDTQSLIVDLRECHGGNTDAVTLAESYLVPANTHLLDMYTRATDTTERAIAAADLAGPRYGADKPVFVLIGEDTASGCEAFAYAMQAQKRATVIGANSAGAAYFGDPRRLTDHFMAFVPVGRPIDPITHGDWEGTGVTPQIVVAPEKALGVAERKSLQILESRETSQRRKGAMRKRIAELN